MNIIVSEAERLTRLINDVLDLAKIETGRIELTLKKFNLKTMLEAGMTMVKETCAKHQIELWDFERIRREWKEALSEGM